MTDAERIRERACVAALALVGSPYVWGGNTPRTGMDCSGFVQWVWSVAGVEPWASDFPARIDLRAADLWRRLAPPAGGVALPGDLAFYGPHADAVPTHVVIVIGEGRLIGTSRGDSKCRSFEDAVKRGAYVRVHASARYRTGFLGYRAMPVEG